MKPLHSPASKALKQERARLVSALAAKLSVEVFVFPVFAATGGNAG